MTNAKNASNEDTAVGCLGLILLGVVGLVINFVVEHWEFFLGAGLGIAAIVVVVLVARATIRGTVGKKRAAEASAEQARRARVATLEKARHAGESDMRAAWLEWQLGSPPAQQAPRLLAAVSERLAVLPKASWNVAQLRMHGRAVWGLRNTSDPSPLQREVEARLDRVAAMISDLGDGEFDTGRGQTDDQYLYHPDREIRAAYLEGGAKGIETIMGTITAARTQAREDAAAKAAADALARQRNAALKALRETQQPTETRDAHTAWEAEAQQIDE
ncbi:hypothetical protein GCM10011374_21190 [Kocuria dechangensis]|uniref:Uncharacterized protein n=1 Tax=Kocuria dechangensis TaxID=1176249 RepID=A0A917LUY6_9MICC|nr:hypothetical protein [Kocuria dechangensis]GGG58149.1 hypothetical protein GCM10011374_21190 [Kocuria dechangensis]